MAKYEEYIMNNVRQNLGLKPNDISKDDIINKMTKAEVFKRFLIWKGIIGFDCIFKEAISDIYKVDLRSIDKEEGEDNY